VTLLAFAAKRRAAAPLLLIAGRAAVDRSPAESGAQQQTRISVECCGQVKEQTDRRTDTRPIHRPCSAYCESSVSVELIASCPVAEWLACWTQAQKGLGSNHSRDAVG